MPSPNIAQGTLNKLIGSLVWTDFPTLNVTPSYLLPEGIDLAFEGEATVLLPSMTGLVTSPEPYQKTRVMIHLNKAQALAEQYKIQLETNTLMGALTIYTDSPTISVYNLINCALTGIASFTIAGRDAGYVMSVQGAYNINSALWP